MMQKPVLFPAKMSMRGPKIKMLRKIAFYNKIQSMKTGVNFKPAPEETPDDRLPEYER